MARRDSNFLNYTLTGANFEDVYKTFGKIRCEIESSSEVNIRGMITKYTQKVTS